MDSIQAMRKYQNDFSIKFAKLMQSRLNSWLRFQKEERKSLYSLGSFGMYFLAAFVGFIPGKNEREYNLEMHCYFAVICFIIAIIINIDLTNKRYQRRIKGTLFPELLPVFGDDVKYALGDGTTSIISQYVIGPNQSRLIDSPELVDFDAEPSFMHKIPDQIFENSKLYPRNIESREDDDVFYGLFKDVNFIINEVDFGWRSNDKNRTYHSMFKGVSMFFKMNKTIKNRVLIVSKFSGTKIPKGYEKVELEYTKFRKKYDVWVRKTEGASDQIEARYLLNAVFLDRFMQIQTSFRVNKMCASICGDEMLIMLSTRKDLFEMNHLFGRIDDTKQYKHLFEEFASVLSFIEVLNLSSKTKL